MRRQRVGSGARSRQGVKRRRRHNRTESPHQHNQEDLNYHKISTAKIQGITPRVPIPEEQEEYKDGVTVPVVLTVKRIKKAGYRALLIFQPKQGINYHHNPTQNKPKENYTYQKTRKAVKTLETNLGVPQKILRCKLQARVEGVTENGASGQMRQ